MLTCEIADNDLKKIGLELMFMTPEKCAHDDGITAVELAKMVELSVDIVKKKLVILKEKGMDEDDDVYKLLCNFDDVDFDRYFQY